MVQSTVFKYVIVPNTHGTTVFKFTTCRLPISAHAAVFAIITLAMTSARGRQNAVPGILEVRYRIMNCHRPQSAQSKCRKQSNYVNK